MKNIKTLAFLLFANAMMAQTPTSILPFFDPFFERSEPNSSGPLIELSLDSVFSKTWNNYQNFEQNGDHELRAKFDAMDRRTEYERYDARFYNGDTTIIRERGELEYPSASAKKPNSETFFRKTAASSPYQLYSKTWHERDAEERPLLSESKLWESVAQTFVDFGQVLYSYDSQKRQIGLRQRVFENGVWHPQGLDTSGFSASGKLLFERSFRWDASLAKLTERYSTEFEYDLADRLVTKTIFYLSGPAMVISPNGREVFGYNSQGLNDTTRQFFFDQALQTWVLSGIKSQVFNASGELIEQLLTNLPLGNQSKTEFVPQPTNYSERPEFSLESWKSAGGTVFHPSVSNEWKYTELGNGRVHHFFGIKYPDPDLPSGSPLEYIVKSNAFYHIAACQPTTSILENEAESTAFCHVRNPFSISDPVRCEQLEAEKSYVLKLYDVVGRLIYLRNFRGGEAFYLNASLPTGLHFLSFWQNGRLVSSQKILLVREP